MIFISSKVDEHTFNPEQTKFVFGVDGDRFNQEQTLFVLE